jgi:hypothetical protein
MQDEVLEEHMWFTKSQSKKCERANLAMPLSPLNPKPLLSVPPDTFIFDDH